MRFFISTLFFCQILACSYLVAQTTSSTAQPSDSLRLNELIELADTYADEMEFDSACVYFKQAFDYAIQLNNVQDEIYTKKRIAYIYSAQAKYDASLSEYQYILERAIETNNLPLQVETYVSLGLIKYRFSSNNEAIELLLKGLKIGEELQDQNLLKNVYNQLANVNAALENDKETEVYQRKALDIAIHLKDSLFIGLCYNNMADTYTNQNNYPLALEYLAKAEKIQKGMTPMDEIGLGYTYLMIGFIFKDQGDLKKAENYYLKALQIREKTGTQFEKALIYNDIAELNFQKRTLNTAKSYLKKSLDITVEAKVLELIPTSYLYLAQIDSLEGNYKSAYKNMQNYVFYEEELNNNEKNREATLSQMKFEIEKRDALKALEQEKKDALAAEELRLRKLQRNIFSAGFAIMLLFAGVFLVQRNRISKEKDRSENLLLNILPYETAQELKEKGYADAQPIEQVSVLFTDFKGFTQLSETLSPSQLVAAIHECFSEFDAIVGKYGVEKIKTIGDAYMAAGGLPTPNKTHPIDVIKAAVDIQHFMTKLSEEKKAKGEPFFEIRIGVHTGPVVAGIVGIKKFQYDIWGDTVNTASRMESSGAVGKVNISDSTYEFVKDLTVCEYRGEIEAKGKGKVKMYFVNEILAV